MRHQRANTSKARTSSTSRSGMPAGHSTRQPVKRAVTPAALRRVCVPHAAVHVLLVSTPAQLTRRQVAHPQLGDRHGGQLACSGARGAAVREQRRRRAAAAQLQCGQRLRSGRLPQAHMPQRGAASGPAVSRCAAGCHGRVAAAALSAALRSMSAMSHRPSHRASEYRTSRRQLVRDALGQPVQLPAVACTGCQRIRRSPTVTRTPIGRKEAPACAGA